MESVIATIALCIASAVKSKEQRLTEPILIYQWSKYNK